MLDLPVLGMDAKRHAGLGDVGKHDLTHAVIGEWQITDRLPEEDFVTDGSCLGHGQDVIGVGLMDDAEHGKVAQRLGFSDLLLYPDLFSIFGRRELVGHVNDGRDAAAHRRGRSGREVLLVGNPGIAEVHVGIDQAGQDVQIGGIDCLPTFWQSVVCADCDDPALIDGDAALERRLRGYDRPVFHDQICFHHILPYLGWLGADRKSALT